jgi:hypothetical protein
MIAFQQKDDSGHTSVRAEYGYPTGSPNTMGHVARMVEKRNAYRLLVGKPEGKRPLGRPRRRWIILGWILEKWDGVMWTGLVWLRIGTGGELL